MKCFRCGNEITEHPDASNADYIMANDSIGIDTREVLSAVLHNDSTLQKTLDRKDDPEIPPVKDTEYDRIAVDSAEQAINNYGGLLIRLEVALQNVPIQKTAIICPACYQYGDNVIWGVHKKR